MTYTKRPVLMQWAKTWKEGAKSKPTAASPSACWNRSFEGDESPVGSKQYVCCEKSASSNANTRRELSEVRSTMRFLLRAGCQVHWSSFKRLLANSRPPITVVLNAVLVNKHYLVLPKIENCNCQPAHNLFFSIFVEAWFSPLLR